MWRRLRNAEISSWYGEGRCYISKRETRSNHMATKSTKRPYQEWKTKPYPSHIPMMPDKAQRTSTSRQESYRENREDIGAFGEFLMNVMRRADAQKWIAVTPSASRQLIHPCQRKERRPIGTEFNCRKSGMSTGMKDLGIGTYYWTEPIFIVSTSRHK